MSTDLSATPSTEFSIGRVLKDTLSVLRANLAGCAVVAVAYLVLWHMIFLFVDDQSGDGFRWWNFAVSELWRCVVGGLANAALTYVFLLALSGGRPSLRDLVRGLSFAVPIMVARFIVDLPMVVGELLAAADPGGDETLIAQFAVGIVTYIVYVVWFVAQPAVVAEGLGVLPALRRSTFLTGDRRWPMFGLIFVTGIAFWALGWAAATVGDAVNAEFEHTGSNLVFWIGGYVLPAVGLVFWSALQAVVYCALRLAKEGAGIQELARVFD